MATKRSPLTAVVAAFLKGNLPLLLIIGSLLAGIFALKITPREEEPQIVVPVADVMVSYPQGSVEEVEKLVSSRLERMLAQIDGVEYVYSMSRPGQAVVTVRFFVGEDREDSLIKLYNKMQQNADKVTPGVTGWVVKPIEIDDVPIVNATLYSGALGAEELYRIAEELVGELQQTPDTGRITIHGGQPRIANITLKPERLAAYHLTPAEVAQAVRASNVQLDAGSIQRGGTEIALRTGPLLESPAELRLLMVGVNGDRPVYLRDIAEIADTYAETTSYSRMTLGPADPEFRQEQITTAEAVTIAITKKKGANAVTVAQEIRQRLDQLTGQLLPDNVDVRITRDYGLTANDKVNDLVMSLALAVLTVIGLLALTMSWREGIIVALAVPVTYSLTLMSNYLLGYTINRVTLFALILALGLLVDDPIACVENIERHLRKGTKDRIKTITDAMNEIMPPVLLSTIAIIIAFSPMSFITGMMGPYMAPMALNVPIAVVMSTVVALTITPWLCNKILHRKQLSAAEGKVDIQQTGIYRLYSRMMTPLVEKPKRRVLLLATISVLFVGSMLLAAFGLVPLKMLPFDNKNEFQVLVDLPETAPLEQTDAVTRDLEEYLRTVPEVTEMVTTVGEPSPVDFNGMVRHYYLRYGPNMADLRVNLVHRTRRKHGSHTLALRIRDELTAIGERHGAVIKLVELPPGPPVLSSLVAEITGEPGTSYDELIRAAGVVKKQMAHEAGVVDLDDMIEASVRRRTFIVDREKAGRNGVAVADVAAAMRLAVSGETIGTLHIPAEQNEVPIVLRLPRDERTTPEQLLTLPVRGRNGNMVQIGELGSMREEVVPPTIFHKNQQRIVYVTSEVAGRGPAYAVLSLQKHFSENPLPEQIKLNWAGEGEWKITLDVFRDLGIAFGIALLGIYVLLVYETSSYLLPVVIMLSIPLTAIGIMPGFWLLNVLGAGNVSGYADSVFFTATAMIGMIALSGIVVRNAIVLIDFIKDRTDQGLPLREAILESGAVRFRPIVLTAGTTLLGTWPITFDPIFSGLAWSIIFGLLVSTVFTLLVIPTVYLMLFGKKEQ